MIDCRFLLLGALLVQLSAAAVGMECSALGIAISCPTLLDKNDEVFCCQSNAQNVQYCCDFENFVKQNIGILVGVLVAVLIVLAVLTLCCCCFCSCCALAKRRTHRGQVYGQVRGQHGVIASAPSSSYAMVHPPPTTSSQSPPPYSYTNSSFPDASRQQLPQNPDYRY